jgi:TolA-binding protein
MVDAVDSVHKIYKGKIDSKNIFISPDFKKHKPLTVAILPLENLSREEEASKIMRRLLYNNFSSLAYSDVEPAEIDREIPNFKTHQIFKKINPQKIGKKLRTDAIIVGKVTEFESLYAGIYSSISVETDLKMLDTETGELLWSVKHKETQRTGSIPTSALGAILAAASTALDLTRYNFISTANHLCRAVVETIPDSSNLKGRSSPKIAAMAHDGMKKTLKKGDRLQVGIEGTPGLNAEFFIKPESESIRMEEKEPGSYMGTYVVREGTEISDGLIVVKLFDRYRNASTWEDTLGNVNIDGVPPSPVTGLKTIPGNRSVRLKWNPSDAKDVVKYHILRSKTPLTGYKVVRKTEFTSFKDKAVTNRSTYFYRITAADMAGNMSQPLPGISSTPLPPGPTILKGAISKDTTLYPGANPYILKGNVSVPNDIQLFINPGVIIKGNPKSALTVNGLVTAAGEADSPVIFSAVRKNRRWEGIVFKNAKVNSSMSHFSVTDAKNGIHIVDCSPNISKGTIKHCETGIRIQGNTASPLLKQLTVYQNKMDGILISGLAHPRITHSRIAYNEKSGIVIDSSPAKVLANEIRFNLDGITLKSSNALVGGNQIVDNRRTAMSVKDSSSHSMKVDLNYFGYPSLVRAFSSQNDLISSSIEILETSDYKSPRKKITVKPFPESVSKDVSGFLIVTHPGKIFTASGALFTPSKKTHTNVSDKRFKSYIAGISAVQNKNYKKAIPLLEYAKEDTSRRASSLYWLGFCYLETGQYTKAVVHYNKASKLEPDNMDYLLRLGIALHMAGSKTDAETVYKEVLKRDPKNKDAIKFLNALHEI